VRRPSDTHPFCALAAGLDADRQQDIVRRTAGALAFVSPRWWPGNHGHILVVRVRHYENLYELPDEAGTRSMIWSAMSRSRSAGPMGARESHNEPAGDQNAWHYHMHVFPRYPGDQLYTSSPYLDFVVTAGQRTSYAERLRSYFAADR
jgi:histidine triad (HIT) family protein